MSNQASHPIGVIRREFLQVGFSGYLGLSAASVLTGRAVAAGARKAGGDGAGKARTPRARSMILVFLTGGLSHLDSFDMKPDAPEGIRGTFRPIETSAPGVFICEHLPRLAARADQLAVVRTIAHGHTNHLNATHQLLTGSPQPGAFFDKIASRDDYPCHAAGLDYVRPRNDGIPSGVMLPTFLMEGPLVWPGQHAGFLGPKHDPWQIRQNPNQPDFRVDSLSLPVGFSVERLEGRQTLLKDLSDKNSLFGRDSGSLAADPMSEQRERAMSLMLTGNVSRAFDLNAEDPALRDRYGRHEFGQSLLLARKLVEAGVPIVQVNMGRVQTWDTHSGNFESLKDRLLPPTDQGVSALLDDLQARGLLDETLVIVSGEFGRTPRIGASTGNNNTADGRDHWASVFSAVFAGAGVQGGQVIGQSDRIGAYPASRPYSPGDVAATIYDCLGVDPATEVVDRLNRPIRLCNGEAIAPLFTGA